MKCKQQLSPKLFSVYMMSVAVWLVTSQYILPLQASQHIHAGGLINTLNVPLYSDHHNASLVPRPPSA